MLVFYRLFSLVLILGLFSGCIGDDIVDDYVAPQIRITNPVAEIEAGTTYLFTAGFLNNVGMNETVSPTWSSSDPTIMTIDQTGLATGIMEGPVRVTVAYTDEFGETADRSYDLEIGASTVVVEEPMFRTGRVATTTFYDLEGDFTLEELPEEVPGDLRLIFGEDYVADDGLPGLYVYLSNNPNSTSGAHEIARVEVFRGAHEYIISGVDLNEFRYVLYFCKPFNVKVGDGLIEE